MIDQAEQFWRTASLENFKAPNSPKFYEGKGPIEKIVKLVGSGSVRDVGCGYGRLCDLFDAADYIGYDISQTIVTKAIEINPTYTFKHWDSTPLAPAKTTLFVNGPQMVSHERLPLLLDVICADTSGIVFAEIMDSKFVDSPPWPNFRRDIEEYDEMLFLRGFVRVMVEFDVQAYWNHRYTVARWERS